MNIHHRRFSVAAFALVVLGASAAMNQVSAETCMGNVKKCSTRCEIKHQGDAPRADKCEQNCNTAYDACTARNQPRRPIPSDPQPKHKRPADANTGNKGVQPTDPKHTGPANASSGSRSRNSK